MTFLLGCSLSLLVRYDDAGRIPAEHSVVCGVIHLVHAINHYPCTDGSTCERASTCIGQAQEPWDGNAWRWTRHVHIVQPCAHCQRREDDSCRCPPSHECAGSA